MSRLWCGACGWNYTDWRGRFYPKELAQSKWLGCYAEHFDTVEINNSFYRLPEKHTFESWRDQTPGDFVFAVKASRYLTHIKKLKDPEEPLDRLLSHSSGLGEKRGPVLYQLPPRWHVDLDRLEHFLKLLPRDVRSAFEFRDDSWQTEEVWSLLERYSAAYCIMDHPDLPLHVRTTSDFSYVRMHYGDESEGGDYTSELIAEWARRVEELLKVGDVYVYFNNDQTAFAVRNAQALISAVLGEESAQAS